MPAQKLKAFLDDHHISYIHIEHSPAFTAQEIAASAHIPGREIAKTVMVKIDGAMAMAVLPATRKLDLELLQRAADARDVRLASERDFRDSFPDCELGAMPPFGNLYGMRVFADGSLELDDHIAFNAGSHADLIQMKFDDFVRLVNPIIARLAWQSKVSV